MSNQSFAEEQLLELLLQLKKTTPDAARQILNSQPQIAYALITLMVTMNAINFEVFQKTLAAFGSTQAPPAPIASSSTLPPHLQSQFRTSTPPMAMAIHAPTPYTQTQPYPNGMSTAPSGYGRPPPQPQANHMNYNHGHTPSSTYSNVNTYPSSSSYPANGPTPPNQIPDVLAGIPEEQKTMILRVISMTPEQINMLGPAERASIIQLRATLGVPST